jgi:hypothetical protein
MPTNSLNHPSQWILPGEEWIYSLSDDDAYRDHFALEETFKIQMPGDVFAQGKLLHLTNRRILFIDNHPRALLRLDVWDNEQLLTQIELEDVLEARAKATPLSEVLILNLADGRQVQIGHSSSPAMLKLVEPLNRALGTRQPLLTFTSPAERVLFKSVPLSYEEARIEKDAWWRVFPPLDPKFASLPRARLCITTRRIFFYYIHAGFHAFEGSATLQSPWLRWMEAPLQEVQAVQLRSGLGAARLEFSLARGLNQRMLQGCTLPEDLGGAPLSGTSRFSVELKPGLAAAVQTVLSAQADPQIREISEPLQVFSCAPLRAQVSWPAAPTELRAANLQDLKNLGNALLGRPVSPAAGQSPAPQPVQQPVAQTYAPQPSPQPSPQHYPPQQGYAPQPTAQPRGEGCLPGLRKKKNFRLGVLLAGILSLGGCSIPLLISSAAEAEKYTTTAGKAGYYLLPVVFVLLSLALTAWGAWMTWKK